MSAVINELRRDRSAAAATKRCSECGTIGTLTSTIGRSRKARSARRRFFEEIEDYRFEKLDYLPSLVDFDGYRGRRVLDVGCGVGNDLARFARGGAEVVGIDLAETSIDLASVISGSAAWLAGSS